MNKFIFILLFITNICYSDFNTYNAYFCSEENNVIILQKDYEYYVIDNLKINKDNTLDFDIYKILYGYKFKDDDYKFGCLISYSKLLVDGILINEKLKYINGLKYKKLHNINSFLIDSNLYSIDIEFLTGYDNFIKGKAFVTIKEE